MDPQIDLGTAFSSLGILGKTVIAHASLRSLGHFPGGAEALAYSLKRSFSTVMMPAFSYDSIVLPPLNDRPACNGCDYGDRDYWRLDSHKKFRIEDQSIIPAMGRTAQAFGSGEKTWRTPHPWHAWSVYGKAAEKIASSHAWDKPHEPIERCLELDAWVLLIGVDLTSCTAIHLAEEWAGRAPFIRWCLDAEGTIRRIRVAGCAAGFMKLWPDCGDLFREARAGSSRILAAPLAPLLCRARDAIKNKPELTRCCPDCLRCRDAIFGGPEAPARAA